MGTIYQSLLQSSAFIKPNIPLSEKKIPKKYMGVYQAKYNRTKKQPKAKSLQRNTYALTGFSPNGR